MYTYTYIFIYYIFAYHTTSAALTLFRVARGETFPRKYNKLARRPAPTLPLTRGLPFFPSLASNRRACARSGTRKASRVPPHAYCRALLIGPGPGGMKYKNRNKAPLPVPGEMPRYRIRDSAAAPFRARGKQTQRTTAAAPSGIIGARCSACPFFSPFPTPSSVSPTPPPLGNPLSNVTPAGASRSRPREGKDGWRARNGSRLPISSSG